MPFYSHTYVLSHSKTITQLCQFVIECVSLENFLLSRRIPSLPNLTLLLRVDPQWIGVTPVTGEFFPSWRTWDLAQAAENARLKYW